MPDAISVKNVSPTQEARIKKHAASGKTAGGRIPTPATAPAPAPTQAEIDAAAEETDEPTPTAPTETDSGEGDEDEEEDEAAGSPPRKYARPIIQRSVQLTKGGIKIAQTTGQSAAPSGKSELVFLLGAALIIVSGLTNKQLNAVGDLFFNAKKMKYTRQQARVGMVTLGGELLFLIILTAISETSDAFANVALAFLAGLFIVWSMLNVKTSSKWVEFITGKAKNI
jgi:hypothetical protein